MCFYYCKDEDDTDTDCDRAPLLSYGTVIILEPANADSRVNLRISLVAPGDVQSETQICYRVRIRVMDKQSSLDSCVYRGIENCVTDTWDTSDPEGLFDTCTLITTSCREDFEEYIVWITDNVMDFTAWEINQLYGLACTWIARNQAPHCTCISELPLCSGCSELEELNESCTFHAKEFLVACRLIAKNLDASDNAAGRIIAADVLLRRASERFADVSIH
jgi:hypothetical protein